MSVAIIQQPAQRVLAAGNDQVYTVSGSTLGAPNVFDYKFIADLYVNGTLEATLKSFPDPNYGFGVFNMRNIASQFLGYDIPVFNDPLPPSGQTLIYPCPNTAKQMWLEIGEEYTSGNTWVQTRNIVGSKKAIYLNATLSYPDSVNPAYTAPFLGLDGCVCNGLYNGGNYNKLTPGTLSDKPLNPGNNPDGKLIVQGAIPVNWNFKAYPNLPMWQYVLVDMNNFGPNNAQVNAQIQIAQWDANDNYLGSWLVPTPDVIAFPTSGNTLVYVYACGVGYPQLAAIPASNVISPGAHPGGVFSAPTMEKYFVYPPFLYNSESANVRPSGPWWTGGLPQTGSDFPQYYAFFWPMADCGRFAGTDYSVFWLNTVGGFESWLFSKKNETTQKKQTQVYKKPHGTLNANGSFALNSFDQQNAPFFTVLEDQIVLNTDFLTDDEALFLKGLLSSPAVFIQDQNGITTAVVIDQDSYRINKKVNQKKYSLELTVKKSYNDYRQQG